jgi:glycosyltransferase involved in cell wall biosynthesis
MMTSEIVSHRYTKVLEIGPMPPPRAGWGVRIEYVVKALRESGIDCAALDVGPNRKLRREGIDDVPSVWGYLRKVWLYVARGYRVHNHMNGKAPKNYALVLYSTFVSSLFRRPAIVTWHGGMDQKWFPIERGNIIVNTIHRVIFRLSEFIICNDEAIKRCIAAYGVPESKIVPIPAFSREYLEYTEARLPPAVTAFLETHAPVLFCYALCRPEFHLNILFEGFRKIAERNPQCGLVLVGSWEDNDRVPAMIRAAGLNEGQVCLVGDLDHGAFLTLLKRCELCIRTAACDGISSSVLEALALGVPVVAAANPLRPPQVHQYAAEDSSELAAVVLRLLALAPPERGPIAPEIPDTVEQEAALLTGRVRVGQDQSPVASVATV